MERTTEAWGEQQRHGERPRILLSTVWLSEEPGLAGRIGGQERKSGRTNASGIDFKASIVVLNAYDPRFLVRKYYGRALRA